MSLTRRSIVRNLATLSTLPTFSGLLTAVGQAAPPSVATPNPTSAFVLFEGPWLIDQPSAGSLRATTFNQLTQPGSGIHLCDVGLAASGTTALNSPTSAGTGPASLGENTHWNFKGTRASGVPAYPTVAGAAFSQTAFPYVKTGCAVSTSASGRSVVLPIPDNIYIACPLTAATFTGVPLWLQAASGSQTVQGYTCIIFEYTKSNRPAAIPLTETSGSGIGAPAGGKLVFRMHYHATPGQPLSPDAVHAHNAFMALVAMVSKGTQALPVSISVTDATVVQGNYPAGFTGTDFGIEPSGTPIQPMDGTGNGTCSAAHLFVAS